MLIYDIIIITFGLACAENVIEFIPNPVFISHLQKRNTLNIICTFEVILTVRLR